MHAKKLTITNRQKALLHAVMHAHQIPDAQYREILEEAAGVRSSNDLTQAGFDAVLHLLRTLGYELSIGQPKPRFTARADRASPRQLQYIEALRRKVLPDAHERAFNHWLDRYFHISHLHFLTPRKAQGVIEALKAMKVRTKDKRGDNNMIAYVTIVDEQTVRVRARAEGDDGTVGDKTEDITVGQSAFGIPYERLRSAAPGKIEIPGD